MNKIELFSDEHIRIFLKAVKKEVKKLRAKEKLRTKKR